MPSKKWPIVSDDVGLTPLGLGSSQPASRAARARAETVTKKLGPHSRRGVFLRPKRDFLCRSAAPQVNSHRGRVASR